MPDDELTAKVSMDVSDATRSSSDLETRLAALEKAYVRLSGEATKSGKSVKKSGDEAKEATTLWERLALGFKTVADHSRTAGIALNQVGLQAEAGAAKMAGLAEVFERLGKTTPMLLGVGAAVTGIFAAFEAGKGAVEKASEWQANMSRLGVVVKNQGGDWKELSKSVKEWSEVQEKTTQFSRDEAVSAITKLTAAGMKLADAQTTVRVAEDAAAATHSDLNATVGQLMAAEHGRTMGLMRMGLVTKEQMKHGVSFNEILKTIEKRMGGSAQEALNTYEGRIKQLGNTFNSLQQEVGEALLPGLQKLATMMVTLVQNATTGFHDMQKAGEEWIKSHKEIMSVAHDLYTGLATVVGVAFNYISATWKQLGNSIGLIFNVIEDILENKWPKIWDDMVSWMSSSLDNAASIFGDWGKEFVFVAKAFAGEVGGIFHDLWADIASGNVAGLLSVGASAGGRIGAAVSSAMAEFKKQANAHLHGGTHGESGFNPAVTSITGGEELLGGGGTHKKKVKHGPKHPYDPHVELLVHQIEASAAARKKSVESIHDEEQALQKLLNTEKMSVDLRTRIIKQVGELKQEEQKLIQQQGKEAVAAYNKRMEAEKKDYEQFIAHLEKQREAGTITYGKMAELLRDYVKTHEDLTDEMFEHAYDLEDAWTAKQQTEDEKRLTKLQKQLEQFQKNYDKFYNELSKQAQDWSSKTAGYIEDVFSNKGKKHVNEFKEFFKSALKDIEQALLKSVLFEAFFGSATKSAGGAPSFGSVFTQNLGMAKGSSSNPLLGAMSMFATAGKSGAASAGQHAPANAAIAEMMIKAGKGGTGAGASGAASSGAMSSGVLGAMIGDTGASQVASSLPTDSLLSLFLGVNAPKIGGADPGSSTVGGAGGGGNGSGGAGGNGGGGGAGNIALPGTAGGVLAAASGLGSAASSIKGLGSLFSGVSGFLGQSVGSIGGMGIGGTVGNAGLAGIGGGLIGLGIGGLMNNGKNDAGIGGAVGGTAGEILGNIFLPGAGGFIGAAAGSILGGVVGGLFGSHDKPNNMPDKYDTNVFGTTIADLQGDIGTGGPYGTYGAEANGQYFQMQSSLASATGGQGGAGWIEKTLAQYANPDGSPGPNTPSWLLPIWSQSVGAFGISATGAGKVSYGSNLSQAYISGATGTTLGPGVNGSYDTLATDLDDFYKNYITQGNTAISPTNTGVPIPGLPNGISVTNPFSNVPSTVPSSNLTLPGQDPSSQGGSSSGGDFVVNLNISADTLAQAISQGVATPSVRLPMSSLQTLTGVGITI